MSEEYDIKNEEFFTDQNGEKYVLKSISEPYFSLIKDGKKQIEGRLYKDFWKTLYRGDVFCLYNKSNKSEILKVKVKNLSFVNTFENITSTQMKLMLPDVTSKLEGIKIYRSIYSLEDEKKYGVCMIYLEDVEKI